MTKQGRRKIDNLGGGGGHVHRRTAGGVAGEAAAFPPSLVRNIN